MEYVLGVVGVIVVVGLIVKGISFFHMTPEEMKAAGVVPASERYNRN